MTLSVEDKIRNLPQKPGVYLLKDKAGKTIYVGKAKALRNRIRSHFRSDPPGDDKHRLMMAKVFDFESIVTDSEIEALILESNFIKEHRPRYNVNLKDDKSYPYIRVTKEAYPRIIVTRKMVRDGSRYYGPYTDVGTMRQLLAALRRIFPVRTCTLLITPDSVSKKKHRVCLQFHIGRCRGPCEGRIEEEDYRRIVNQVEAFIQGKNGQLLKDLQGRMEELSGKRQFEEAAQLRDQIRSISNFHSKQKIVGDLEDERDLVTAAVDDGGACGVVFDIRDGKIINRRHFYLDGVEALAEQEVLSGFLKQYYLLADFIPSRVDIPMPIEEHSEIQDWLTSKKGSPVRLRVPAGGKQAELLAMCTRNARLLLDELRLQKSQAADWIAPSVLALQKDLGLPRPPKRIEAFDVSNLFGQDAVASMVLFENGKPLKSGYRKFKIRNVEGIDDYRMMDEVVGRRVSRLLKENQPLPDLMLIDGGKGQLAAAAEALRRCGAGEQAVLGLAKRLEEIFRPGLPDPQTLPKYSPSLRLLQHVRDEAHRFAVTFHRSLHRKRAAFSVLDSVPGIGGKRRNALLKHFGSVEKMKEASVEEIAGVEGMNRKVAERVKEALGGPRPSADSSQEASPELPKSGKLKTRSDHQVE
jgi:excinuclease ABC subunit C